MLWDGGGDTVQQMLLFFPLSLPPPLSFRHGTMTISRSFSFFLPFLVSRGEGESVYKERDDRHTTNANRPCHVL